MARKDRLLGMAERGRFLATLNDGTALDGLLLDWDEGHLVFADCHNVNAGGDRLSIDGEVWLPRSQILYMQKTGAA